MSWIFHHPSAPPSKGGDSEPIIALAPMADMTDGPFCRVCREVATTPSPLLLKEGTDTIPALRRRGGPQGRGGFTSPPPSPYKGEGDERFVIFREMVSAEAIVRGNEKTLKMCAFEEIERPIVLQLFGGSPVSIAKAAEIVVNKFKPDGIDINMGCPVPKIAAKNHAGAALMKDHERACAIVRELKKADLGVPVSVKTRLGWSNPKDILEFASKLEQAGADLLTIHGRTKTQGYSGKADWVMIGEAKKCVKIPVIANGDVNSAEDIKKCLEITGADGVMIGRAALGNPWIFTAICHSEPASTCVRQGGRSEESLTPTKWRDPSAAPRDDNGVTTSERVRVVLRHAQLHLEHYGPKSMVTFRKHLLQYFKGDLGIKNIKETRAQLARVNDFSELEILLKEMFVL